MLRRYYGPERTVDGGKSLTRFIVFEQIWRLKIVRTHDIHIYGFQQFSVVKKSFNNPSASSPDKLHFPSKAWHLLDVNISRHHSSSDAEHLGHPRSLRTVPVDNLIFQ
jgi:hypothetical protein